MTETQFTIAGPYSPLSAALSQALAGQPAACATLVNTDAQPDAA